MYIRFLCRLSWLAIFWVVSSAGAQSGDQQSSFLQNYVEHLKERRALIAKRLEINQKLTRWRGGDPELRWKNGMPEPQANDADFVQGRTKLSRLYQENEDYRMQLEFIDEDLRLVRRAAGSGSGVPGMMEGFSKLERDHVLCSAEACQSDLKKLTGTAHDVFLVSHRVLVDQFIQARKKQFSGKDMESSFELAAAMIGLERSAFLCSRILGGLTDKRILNPSGLATCMSAKINESLKKGSIKSLKNDFPTEIYTSMWSDVMSPEASITFRRTGKEEELRDWVNRQPEYTVKPWDVFTKVLELNDGNIHAALRTAFNTLRENRTVLSFQRRLMDIRGDRPQGGDNSGDWYHFFGTMLTRAVYGKLATLGAWIYSFSPGSAGDIAEQRMDQAGLETMRLLQEKIDSQLGAAADSQVSSEDACQIPAVFSFAQ